MSVSHFCICPRGLLPRMSVFLLPFPAFLSLTHCDPSPRPFPCYSLPQRSRHHISAGAATRPFPLGLPQVSSSCHIISVPCLSVSLVSTWTPLCFLGQERNGNRCCAQLGCAGQYVVCPSNSLLPFMITSFPVEGCRKRPEVLEMLWGAGMGCPSALPTMACCWTCLVL